VPLRSVVWHACGVNASDGVFAPTHRALSVGILLSITAIASEGMAVATIMPSAALDIGGLDAYGWAFSAFMLASLVGAINAGQAADRGDPCAPARMGFAAFSLGLIVAAVAPSWPVLLLGRGLQGFGAGCLTAIAYVAVARGYPERLRPRLLALLSSAWIMPALLGPALAGQVAEHASWRLVFVGVLPPVAVGAWMLLPSLARLPEATSPSTDARRVLASVRLAAGAALVLLAVPLAAGAGVVLPPLDWQGLLATVSVGALGVVLPPVGLPGLLAAVIVGALGVVLAAPALRTLLPSGTFTGRTGLPAAVAVRGLLAFGFFGSEALMPLGLSTQRSLPPSLVGLSLTAGALAWVVGSWVQDRAESQSAGSVPERAIRVAAGLLLVAIGIAGVAAAILSPNLPVELVVLAWGIGGLGMGLAYPASTLTALGTAPGGQEGLAAASLQVAETVGIATGTGAAGALLTVAAHLDRAMSDGLAWAFILALAAILAALAPTVRLAPRTSWAARWRPKPTG
jgi:MFS family permease